MHALEREVAGQRAQIQAFAKKIGTLKSHITALQEFEKKIRVIADEGQIGLMDIESALKLASERDLDLVEISPNADPPVCKIMDYQKFKFDKGKKLQKSRKKQATLTLKQIRMRPLIGTMGVLTDMFTCGTSCSTLIDNVSVLTMPSSSMTRNTQ